MSQNSYKNKKLDRNAHKKEENMAKVLKTAGAVTTTVLAVAVGVLTRRRKG